MPRPPTPACAAPDPAAEHARQLLRALACERAIPDRPEAAVPALEWSRSGAMSLTGEAAGPPGFAAGALASAARGAGLALAALAPQAGFAALDAPALLGERAAAFGLTRNGRRSCGGSAALLPLADGGIALNLPRDDDWRLLEAWLECALPDVAPSRDWSRLAQALRTRETTPLVERGREIGLAVAPLVAPGVVHAVAPRFASCFTSRAAPRFASCFPSRAAPRIALVDAPFSASGAAPRAASEAAAGRSSRPRVLDLSTLWAGPLAGSLLRAAGCDVLKVESPERPDGARAGDASFFALLNGGKRACALDLAAARDREVFAQLLDAADVVLESARPRALGQLGFDAAAWVGGRPGRIWASITGYGREHEWIAFGDDAAVAAGLAFEPGASAVDPREAARFCGDAIADPLTGLHAAVAILAGLSHGRGGLLDLALADVAAHAMGPPTEAAWTLPRAWRDDRWQVWNGVAWEAVAPPRARTPQHPPPPLAPPDPEMLARWMRGC